MTSNARAQRLLDEFEEGAAFAGGHSIRHGIAAVLRHIADTEDYTEDDILLRRTLEGLRRTLEGLAADLTAPTLMERALAGDATAARQFLHEAGFTDKQGQWLPQYQPISEALDD